MRTDPPIKLLKRSVLSSSPEIWTDRHRLYAGTAWIYRCLNLFFYGRRVIVDRKIKQIEICVTTFWFFTSKTYIPFSDVEAIDISAREIDVDQGGELDMFENKGFGGHDPIWIYYVQARTRSSPCPVSLFSFVDNGSATFGGLGLSRSDEGIDPPGPEKKKADQYARLLSDFIGVPLWGDRQVQFNFDPGDRRECAHCGHHVSLRAIRCPYCGYVNDPAGG